MSRKEKKKTIVRISGRIPGRIPRGTIAEIPGRILAKITRGVATKTYR